MGSPFGLTSGNAGTSSAPGNLYGPYASRPAAKQAGRIYVSSDGPIAYVDTGTTWLPIVPGVVPGPAEVAPDNVSPFTTANTSSASVATVQGGVVSLVASSPGSGLNFQTQDMLYTPGQTVTAWLSTLAMTSGGARVGIYLSNNVLPNHTNFATWCLQAQNGGQQYLTTDNIYYNGSWNNGGTIGPGVPSNVIANNERIGLRISGSGSDYNFAFSIDGISWVTLNAVTNMTAYLTPSHCGFFIDASGTANYPAGTLLAWEVA